MKPVARQLLLLLLAVGLLFTAAPLPAQAADQPATAVPGSGYILERGDVLSIAVWQNQELTRTVNVLPDGNIVFPLAGTVKAAARPLADFHHEMEERLRSYIPNLVLTINVEQARSMMFYVVGKVHRPGDFPLNGDISILQGLAMAGGITEFAKPDRIKLLRKKGGGVELLDFNYDEVSKGRALGTNIALQRGDTIVVQ